MGRPGNPNRFELFSLCVLPLTIHEQDLMNNTDWFLCWSPMRASPVQSNGSLLSNEMLSVVRWI